MLVLVTPHITSVEGMNFWGDLGHGPPGDDMVSKIAFPNF